MTDATKILTVEDEPTIRSGIVAFFEDSGFEMLQAVNGRDGLSQFHSERPDVVLCDLRLPDIDGLDVLSEISHRSPETPVIIVSGAGMVTDAIQALKRGAWDFVTKPISDMGVLENAVAKGLERARLMRENREYQQQLERVNQELTKSLRQLQADEEAGREIQVKLLPEDNRILGEFRFQRRLYPSMYLSGDFVDYFVIDRKYIGFYIADVSGHGAASAFVTVMLKTLMSQYLEAYLQEADTTILEPAQALSRLNQDLHRQQLDQYLTMFYGVLDTELDTLVCSNGGQYPYPILVAGQDCRPLVYPSRPVGLFEDAVFKRCELKLPQQFALLLVSDGFLELMTEKSNRERYAELVSRMTETRHELLLDELTADFGIDAQEELPDDVTLLSLTRLDSDE